MKKFVPLKKQSKAAQQTYHSRQRAGWGCVNPAARVEKDRHQYDRKQAKALLRVGLSNILDNELNGGKPMEGFHR